MLGSIRQRDMPISKHKGDILEERSKRWLLEEDGAARVWKGSSVGEADLIAAYSVGEPQQVCWLKEIEVTVPSHKSRARKQLKKRPSFPFLFKEIHLWKARAKEPIVIEV